MKEKEPFEFNWTGLFFATALSFFAFAVFIKLIKGVPAHMTLFFMIGCVSLGFGLLGLIARLPARRIFKKVK